MPFLRNTGAAKDEREVAYLAAMKTVDDRYPAEVTIEKLRPSRFAQCLALPDGLRERRFNRER